MIVEPQEDFSHLVYVNDEVVILFRELRGEDIYYIELFRDSEDDEEILSSPEFLNSMVERLSVEPYKIDIDRLTDLRLPEYSELLRWFCENRLAERVMTLNTWLTLCFHLGKQRWTSDLDWYEKQPIIKILQMSNIQADYHEKVNKELSKK